MSDPYEQSYEAFRNKRMKPRRNNVTEQANTTTEQTKDIELTAENVAIYEAAAEMYRSGDKEGAVAVIKDKLGDEAAEQAAEVMAEADKLQAEAEKAKADDSAQEATVTDAEDNK